MAEKEVSVLKLLIGLQEYNDNNFLFLPVAVVLFIVSPLKPHTLKHPNQIYANKRNSFMV